MAPPDGLSRPPGSSNVTREVPMPAVPPVPSITQRAQHGPCEPNTNPTELPANTPRRLGARRVTASSHAADGGMHETPRIHEASCLVQKEPEMREGVRAIKMPSVLAPANLAMFYGLEELDPKPRRSGLVSAGA